MPTLPTLRQLGYLVELSERLNFRVAAEAQLVTQSTLSAGIKELERLLGVQLVERDKRRVRLTAVGEDVVANPAPWPVSMTSWPTWAQQHRRPITPFCPGTGSCCETSCRSTEDAETASIALDVALTPSTRVS